jgi:zinc and cadmium transporter
MWVNSAYEACALMSVLSFGGALVWCAVAGFSGGSRSKRREGFFDYTCLTVAAAAMVGDACLHMIPETFAGADEAAAERYGLLLVAGCGAVLLFEAACEAWGAGDVEPFGLANLAVEGLHNFADGLALGVAWATSPEAGLATTIAVAVHELPQELGDFAVLKRAGFRVPALLAANFAASLTCFAGAALARAPLVLDHQNELVAFTGGSFLGLALHSLAPRALEALRAETGSARALASAWCVLLCGASVVFLLFVGELEHAAMPHGHGGHGHDGGHDHHHHDHHDHHDHGREF